MGATYLFSTKRADYLFFIFKTECMGWGEFKCTVSMMECPHQMEITFISL